MNEETEKLFTLWDGLSFGDRDQIINEKIRFTSDLLKVSFFTLERLSSFLGSTKIKTTIYDVGLLSTLRPPKENDEISIDDLVKEIDGEDFLDYICEKEHISSILQSFLQGDYTPPPSHSFEFRLHLLCLCVCYRGVRTKLRKEIFFLLDLIAVQLLFDAAVEINELNKKKKSIEGKLNDEKVVLVCNAYRDIISSKTPNDLKLKRTSGITENAVLNEISKRTNIPASTARKYLYEKKVFLKSPADFTWYKTSRQFHSN
jgi:hypothetical protein